MILAFLTTLLSLAGFIFAHWHAFQSATRIQSNPDETLAYLIMSGAFFLMTLGGAFWMHSTEKGN